MESPLHVGQSVVVTGRGLRGRIGYVGHTNFAGGRWVGVELDEERGKNNGSVQGVSYFRCAPNCGLFVRAAQLTLIQAEVAAATARAEAEADAEAEEEEAEKVEANAESKVEKDVEMEKEIAKCLTTTSSQLLKTTRINQPKQFLSSSSQSSLAAAVATAVPTAPKRSKTSVSPSASFCCAKRASFVETGFLEILQPQFTPGKPLRSPIFTSTSSLRSNCNVNGNVSTDDGHRHGSADVARIADLGDELTVTLKPQRVDNRRCHLDELEKVRIQNDQLLEFKTKILEQQGQLERDLQRCQQEVRHAHTARSKCRRELTQLGESVELLTLAKAMAEERAETLQIKLELAQQRIEELCLDVETLRAATKSPPPPPTKLSEQLKLAVAQPPPPQGNLRRLEQRNDDSIIAEVTDNFVPAEQQRSKFFLINNNLAKIKNFLLNYYSL